MYILLTDYRFWWVELQLSTFFSLKSRIQRRDAFKRKLEKLDQEVGIPVLADVYDEIYDMDTPESEDRSVAVRALKWIMCCQRPLSIEMLVRAVSLDSDGKVDEEVDADYILDICSNFIVLDHNQLAQFAHLSVVGYLMNDTRHGYTTVDAHSQIARTSLLNLLAGSSQNGTNTELFDYTALYWPFHCTSASVNDGKKPHCKFSSTSSWRPESPVVVLSRAWKSRKLLCRACTPTMLMCCDIG